MSPRGGIRGAQADAGINFKHYVEIAQTAERGKFDMIFLADNIGVREAKWRRCRARRSTSPTSSRSR